MEQQEIVLEEERNSKTASTLYNVLETIIRSRLGSSGFHAPSKEGDLVVGLVDSVRTDTPGLSQYQHSCSTERHSKFNAYDWADA